MMRLALLEAGQTDLRQGFFHARGNFRFAQAKLLRAERHIFLHRRAKQLVVRVLKNQPDLPPDFFQISGRKRLAINFHRAVAGKFLRQQPVQMQQQGGLAGTVRPEQRDALARQHAKADAAQRLRAVAVTVFQIGDFNRVHFKSAPKNCHVSQLHVARRPRRQRREQLEISFACFAVVARHFGCDGNSWFHFQPRAHMAL